MSDRIITLARCEAQRRHKQYFAVLSLHERDGDPPHTVPFERCQHADCQLARDALMAKDATLQRVTALVERWREEAVRLDTRGARYYEGHGSPHPPEWVIASTLRKRADELAHALTGEQP